MPLQARQDEGKEKRSQRKDSRPPADVVALRTPAVGIQGAGLAPEQARQAVVQLSHLSTHVHRASTSEACLPRFTRVRALCKSQNPVRTLNYQLRGPANSV